MSEDDNIGTTPVRPGFAIDVAALSAWMERHVADFAGPVVVEQFRGGQSNPTYRITTPARAYVLRRKPPGALLKGAHAVEREWKVLSALWGAGYPVPRVHAVCTDQAVIGTWFYVMEHVEGRIFWRADLPGIAPQERAGIFDAMNAALAQLHRIDPAEAGLADYGRPGGYLQRQLARWAAQYRNDIDAGRDNRMDRLIDWLIAHVPRDDDPIGVIHGDFRIDNMIFHPTEPRVLAVLDWELSTLGHPGADFAYNAMMYRMPPHIVAGLGGIDLNGTGIPTEAEYLAGYCARTGRSSMPNYDYYMAFCFFRLAAIFHGIKGRVLRGTAASAQARARVAVLPELFDLAWRQAERAGAF